MTVNRAFKLSNYLVVREMEDKLIDWLVSNGKSEVAGHVVYIFKYNKMFVEPVYEKVYNYYCDNLLYSFVNQNKRFYLIDILNLLDVYQMSIFNLSNALHNNISLFNDEQFNSLCKDCYDVLIHSVIYLSDLNNGVSVFSLDTLNRLVLKLRGSVSDLDEILTQFEVFGYMR
jgi:hypothetical protein